MSKSLDMSSRGIDFDRFMKTLIKVPKEAIDKALKETKGLRAKRGTPSPKEKER
jgi:hypothetical protein